jgi:hypothetical protein
MVPSGSAVRHEVGVGVTDHERSGRRCRHAGHTASALRDLSRIKQVS